MKGMTNSKQGKGNGLTGGISPAMAAVAGAIAGAGVAIVGAIVLSRKANRDKIGDGFNKAKARTIDFAKKIRGGVEDRKEEVEDYINDGSAEIEKRLSKEKEDLRKAVVQVVDSLDHLAEDTKNKAKKKSKTLRNSIDGGIKSISKKINKTWQK